MSDFFNGLSILWTIGTEDGRFTQLTPREWETTRGWMESEEAWLQERGMGLSQRPARDADEARRWEREQRENSQELSLRNQKLAAHRKLYGGGEGQVFETADGERFVPNTALKAFNEEMAAKGEKPRRVQYFRTRGMMDEDGKTLTDAPVTLKYVEGDPKMDYVMEWFRQNPDARGRMLPEMYRFLGISADDAQREAQWENRRRVAQQAQREGTLRNQGKIGAAELSGMSVGFGGQSLTEQNKGKGGATQAWNWFNARMNPVASTLDEYAQGLEHELASEEGYALLKQRQAEGRPLLTAWEKAQLGLWGDTDAMNTPEAVQEYIGQRLEARQNASEAEAVRGTTFLADVLRATEDSARMGAEFALVNTLLPGGKALKAGVELTKGVKAARAAAGIGAEVAFHAPAKARKLMADKVAVDPGTGELRLTKEGESAWTAIPKGVGAAALEYASEMYTSDLVWRPIAKGIRAKNGGRLLPSKVGAFGRKMVESKAGQATARAMDALAAAPGMDAVRKIAARSGVNLNGVKGMIEESIGEELPANVISAMFNLEGESDREGGLWGQVSGGVADAGMAAWETLKMAPAMAVSVALMGAGTSAAAGTAQGFYNYVMSEHNVKDALRELGVAEEAFKGKSKAELNDLLFETLRTRSDLVESPDAIATMDRAGLVAKLREYNLADMDDLSGVSDEELRQALLNGVEQKGANLLVDKALGKVWKGMVAAYGHRLNHGNVMERLEADIFRKQPWAFDAETRERMREVALLKSMAGSGQYRGTLAGRLIEEMAWGKYAALPEQAMNALDGFEDEFMAVSQTAFPTREQIGKGKYAPSTFKQPLRREQWVTDPETGEGGYTDATTGIRISSMHDEGGNVRYRVDTTSDVAGSADTVDAELAKRGIFRERVALPHAVENVFDTLEAARDYAHRLSSWNNTVKRDLLTKVRAAEAMYNRVRGGNGNGLVAVDNPMAAPAEIQDEIMDRLMATHPKASKGELLGRFARVQGLTSARDGKVYVFLENNNSPYAMLNTIQHEGFHEGLLETFAGDRRKVEAALTALMGDPEAPQWVKRLAQETPKDAVGFEELLAQIAETTDAGPGALRAVNRAMRKASVLSTKDGLLAMTGADANDIIYGAWKARRDPTAMHPVAGETSHSYSRTAGSTPNIAESEAAAKRNAEVEKKYRYETLSERATVEALREQARKVARGEAKQAVPESGSPQGKRPPKAAEPPPRNPEASEPEPVDEPPMPGPEAAGHGEAPAPMQEEPDTVPVDESADEGEALTSEGALGGEPEAEPAPEPQAAPQAGGKAGKRELLETAKRVYRARRKQEGREGETITVGGEERRALERDEEALRQAGVEIVDWVGRPYDEGDPVKVVTFEERDGIDREVYGEMMSPEVRWRNPETGEREFLQIADVVVYRPKQRAEPQAEPEPQAAPPPLSGGRKPRKGQVLPGESLEPVPEGEATKPQAGDTPQAQPAPERQLQDGEMDANGFTRWRGFWVKPDTWKGEEGVLLYDKPDGGPTAFINKKPYTTKKGKSRPGFVTLMKDDRASARRTRALYDWLERDGAQPSTAQAQKPEAKPQKGKPGVRVVDGEGDNRVEVDVDERGETVPGTTRLFADGRVVSTDFAIDPKFGLDGSISRTKRWIEGLQGGPKDSLAIYVNLKTQAVRFVGRGADRLSQENGIDLEKVVPRMNREGIPVIVMMGNRASIQWPSRETSGAEEPKPASEPKSKPQAEADEPLPEQFKRAAETVPGVRLHLDGKLPEGVPFPKGFYTRPKGGVSHTSAGANVKTFAHDGKFYVAIPALFATDNEWYAGRNLGRGAVLEVPDDEQVLYDFNRKLGRAFDAAGIKTEDRHDYPLSREADDAVARRYNAKRAEREQAIRERAQNVSTPASQPKQTATDEEPRNRLRFAGNAQDLDTYDSDLNIAANARNVVETTPSDTPDNQAWLNEIRKQLTSVRERLDKSFPHIDAEALLETVHGASTLKGLLNVLEMRIEREANVKGNPGNAAHQAALDRNTKELKSQLAGARAVLRNSEAWRLTEAARQPDGTFRVPQADTNGVVFWQGNAIAPDLSNRNVALVLLEADQEANKMAAKALPGKPVEKLTQAQTFERKDADALLKPFLYKQADRLALTETYAYGGYIFATDGKKLAMVKAVTGTPDEQAGRIYKIPPPKIEKLDGLPVSENKNREFAYLNGALDVEGLLRQLRAYEAEAVRQGKDLNDEKKPLVVWLWDRGNGRIGLIGEGVVYSDFDISEQVKPIAGVNVAFLKDGLALFRKTGESPILGVETHSENQRRQLSFNGKNDRAHFILMGVSARDGLDPEARIDSMRKWLSAQGNSATPRTPSVKTPKAKPVPSGKPMASDETIERVKNAIDNHYGAPVTKGPHIIVTTPIMPDIKEPAPAQAPGKAKKAPPAKPKVEGSKETQAALGELTDLMSDLGMAREPPETLKHPRTGMLREGPELTPDQRTKVQNAMNKVIASSVKNDGVRTFRDLVRLLFGMLRDTNRKMWEAMKLFLRNAWNQYGDEHDTLGLDEVSRAEARAIFDEVERGDAEAEASSEQPEQPTTEPQQSTEPTASEPTPQERPESQEEPTQPQVIKPTESDYANAKDGDVIKAQGENGKRAAVIKWGEYWLEPTKRTVKVWVQERRGRGRYEQQEREGVNIHGRARDGRPIAAVYSFWEPRDEWTSSKGKTHYGYLHDIGGDTESWSKWNALDAWGEKGMPGLEDARAWIAGATPAGSGTLETTETQGKEADNERTGIQPASGQVGGAMGGQEPSRDRGDGVGGAGAGVPGRGVPVPGGADVPSGLAGEQSSEGVSDDAAGVGGRAGERGEDGGAVPGETLSVQPEGGDRGVRAGDTAEQPSGGDGGRGQGAAQGVQPSAQEPDYLNDDKAATANYVIPEDGNGGLDNIRNARDRIAANLAALRVLKALEKEGRQATRKEQHALSLYTGWGSLGEQLFNEQNPDWADERAELKALLTEAEYVSARRTVQYAHYTPMDVVRGMYDALKAMGVRGANLSAFEAGLGVGRFIGGLPPELRGVRYTGVEMDPLTAAIAKQLYPQATVVNASYQDTGAQHGQYDFIVGNPPYGDIKLSDRAFPDGNGQSLHNFFIMKQIEALRPGGVAAFLVTHYFLDAKDMSARLWIHQRAQFLGAIRMPNALFKTVDASLATDIVFFRKRLPGEAVPPMMEKKDKKGDDKDELAAIPLDSQWIYTDDVTQFGRGDEDANPNKLPLRVNMTFSPNRSRIDMRSDYYFSGDNNNIATPVVVVSTRYGKDKPKASLEVRGLAPTREGIAYMLAHLPIGRILRDKFQPYEPPAPTEQESRGRLSSTQAAKLGGGATHPSLLAGGHFVGADGKLYYTTKGFDEKLVAWPVSDYDETVEKAEYAKNPRLIQSGENKGKPAPFKRWKDVQDPYTKFTPQEQAILKTLVKLREVRFDLMQEELSENADENRMAELRKQLNDAYAAFQKVATGYAGTTTRAPALNDDAIKALMFADPASSQLLGLETPTKNKSGKIVEVTKGAVFQRRVNKPKWKPLDHYERAMDALVANLQETGTIDLDWISARTGKNRETVLAELKERVFIDPETEQPVLRERYLSGDVKTKLEIAENAVAEGRQEYAANVEELKKVIPADLPVEDLYIPIGSPIVLGEMIGQFAMWEMGFEHRDDVRAIFNTQTGTWEVSVKNEPPGLAGRYFTANRSFKEVLRAALNNKTLAIYEKDAFGKSVPDPQATEQVTETIRQIRDQWEDWWPTSDAASELGKRYNERFNRIAEAQYDGSFLGFQGLNPALTPYLHQRDAVWRTVVTGNVLYNHVVGSGKTNSAILSIMEMRRMGRVRKPMVVVPNHLVEQWRNDFLAAYPGANVLATDPSDLAAENRKRYFSRIQNGDYDVIILPHSQLSRISLSPDILKEQTAKQLAEYREALEELKKNGAEQYTVNRIEKAIEKLEKRIDAKLKALRTDDTGLFFDTLGIDGLFLDEAHEFKNVPFVSAVQAKGMGNPSGSSKAFDLLMKINWFRQKRAGAPVVFMTGTPVSNSLTELYLNMLYMAPDLLRKANLNSMDAFLQAFGVVDDRMEVATTGQFKLSRRLRKLMNVPELMRMVRTYMDVVDADDLRGSMESVGRTYDVPELETGAPINIVAKRSPLQEIYFGKEVRKVQNPDATFTREYNAGSIYYRAGHMPKDRRLDNMLKVTNDAMAASLDIRLRKRELIAMGVPESELTDEALDFAGSKVNLCVEQVLTDYKRFNSEKGTQMIFCDRSIPGSARKAAAKELESKRKDLEKARKEAEREELDPTAGFAQRNENEESPFEKVAKLERLVRDLEQELESSFSVYDDIKQKLVARGIPAEEIAFIHDYKTKEQKQALFDAMNAGKIRVLLGSTSRMGAGTNANKRMVSLHHLDAPWRPSDMEQRNGRIIRQGNLLKKGNPDFKIRVYQYGTEKSADAFKFSTLLEKGRAFHGIFKRTNATRNADDIGEGELSNEQMMAQLSGSLLMPLMIEQREGVRRLERQARNHNVKRRNLMDARDNADAETAIIQSRIDNAKQALEISEPKPGREGNYYEGIALMPNGIFSDERVTIEAKSAKERQERPGEERIGTRLLNLDDKAFDAIEGALNSTNTTSQRDKIIEEFQQKRPAIAYRGFIWMASYSSSNLFRLFAYNKESFSAKKPLFTTTDMERSVRDENLIVRMDNAVEKLGKAIPIFEEDLRKNADLLAKLDKQLADYPEVFPHNQELLEARREFADIERAVNADATTAAEARVTLGHYYGKRGLPVPDYEWTRPGFDEAHGVKPDTPTQTGTLREGRWEKRLREELAARGLTESDLSAEAQAYLRAKREREAVLPQGGLRGAVDKLGDLSGRREGESHWDYIKRKSVAAAELVDKKLVDVRAPLIKAQRQIVGEGVELAEDEDIAKAMSLSYGRIVSRHADIDRDFVKPAMKLLSQNGLDVSDLDLYLQATFAPERNKMIQERAEWKEAGAGLTDEEAAARLKGMRERMTATQWQALKEAAGHIYKMNRANLKRLAESGILASEQVAEWLKLSPHYVPLRDDLERLGVEEPDTGGGLRKGGPFRKAVGRYSEAMDSSVGWSVIQAKQGVIWAEQNRIARVTLNFAQNHRSPDDYFVGKVPLKAEKVFRERASGQARATRPGRAVPEGGLHGGAQHGEPQRRLGGRGRDGQGAAGAPGHGYAQDERAAERGGAGEWSARLRLLRRARGHARQQHGAGHQPRKPGAVEQSLLERRGVLHAPEGDGQHRLEPHLRADQRGERRHADDRDHDDGGQVRGARRRLQGLHARVEGRGQVAQVRGVRRKHGDGALLKGGRAHGRADGDARRQPDEL